MKKKRFIHINYFNYWKGETIDHYVMPLYEKLFRRRWYLVGRNWPQVMPSYFVLTASKTSVFRATRLKILKSLIHRNTSMVV